jgi:hypothetical protein
MFRLPMTDHERTEFSTALVRERFERRCEWIALGKFPRAIAPFTIVVAIDLTKQRFSCASNI